jgi:hypothetical protein
MKPMRNAFLFALLLLPLAAAAAVPVTVRSGSPVVGKEIVLELDVFCSDGTPVIERHGFHIVVRYPEESHCGGEPFFPRPLTLALDPLPAGRYEMEIFAPADSDEGVWAAGSFVVRQPDALPFVVHPYAVPANVVSNIEPPMQLRILDPSETDALAFFCGAGCRVFVGGVEAVDRDTGGTALVLVDAPPHAPGIVDVTLVNPAGESLTSHGAVQYFDPYAPPDLALFEHVLFPILFNAPGANGSDWKTETTISNPRMWTVATYNEIQPGQCIDGPCGERLAPRQKVEFTGGEYRGGVALLVPRAEARFLAFASRVRDVSRVAEGFGTEIPVVRESEMFDNGTLTLLEVPRDPRYRTKLRIYSFDEDGTAGTVVAQAAATGAKTSTPFTLTRNCVGSACAAIPAYAELDLPSGREGERVNLYVEMPGHSLAWAFAAVTNNDTQQVTIVTPDGKGGAPCSPCTTTTTP